ncbi:MAG: rhodanese-like domain-containing protein [Ignavibacteriaceae bacterium]|nr:rhodanese-like domain-containing protein [Ignavibacteriaceae bacterium]
MNPKGINLISKPKGVKWASDSLVINSLNQIDTLNNKKKENILIKEKSSFNTKSETTNSSFKPDSLRRNGIKQQIKNSNDEDEGFAEPIGINLEQAYKLYTMGFVFVDARVEEEYKTGHIKNSLNLPIYDFDKHQKELGGISKSQTIVCYCGGSDCDLSTQLANKLFSLGYKNNYIFIGGWEQWKTAGYPVE